MQRRYVYLMLIIMTSLFCYSRITTTNISQPLKQFGVLKLEMFLNAFGVESSGFPTINATIDFVADSGICNVSYYEPWLKEKYYSFTKKQIDTIKTLLKNIDFKKMKKEYKEGPTDQPTSTTSIFTAQDTFRIQDYGLQAKFPMTEVYRIIYDLRQNFR